MPQHITRLVLLIVLAAGAAYAAKRYFTVDTFYQYGHFRGASVTEIAADKPKFKGAASCESCHEKEYGQWEDGVHSQPESGKAVQCEVCHGAAGGRDRNGFEPATTGPEHPKSLHLIVPKDTAKVCTLCHEKMPGRPVEQPQIVVSAHAGDKQCVACHNPHSPKLGLKPPPAPPGDAAAGKEKAAACVDCHGAEGVAAGLKGPTLAGQKKDYLYNALKAYVADRRTADGTMKEKLGEPSDADLANLVAYYSSQKCESGLDAQKQSANPDAAVAAKCVECHGANGVSSSAGWPNLVGFSKDYILKSVNAYKTGARNNSMMTGVAQKLSDADAIRAAAYFSAATCK